MEEEELAIAVQKELESIAQQEIERGKELDAKVLEEIAAQEEVIAREQKEQEEQFAKRTS